MSRACRCRLRASQCPPPERSDGARNDLSTTSGRGQAERDRRHQHLRPQLRRPLRRQRPRRRRPHRAAYPPTRADGSRSCRRCTPARAASARSSACTIPTACNIRCAARGRAAAANSSASPGTRRWTRSRANCCACARELWQCGDPRCLALGQLVGAARPGGGPALPLHVRRLHGAVVEHVGGGRDIRRAHDLWRQGRLQERRARADRLRQLQADRDVGLEPGDGTFGTGTYQYLKQAKKQGVRIVCVDPRTTRTSAVLADEHIFIQPSTDTAALIAMAYVIVERRPARPGLLRRHVLGFDEDASAARRAGRRVLSLVSARPVGRHRRRRPNGRQAITGIPAETIRRLAIEFATTKPAALQCGYAPGRTAFGEQFHRAAYALVRHDRQCRHRRRQLRASATAPRAETGIKSLPTGANPIGARVASPAARRSAGARQGRRLSGRHQADLFGRRRSVQSVPQRQQDGRRARRRRVPRRAGPFPDAHRALRRHRAAGNHLLGAQRRAHAVGRRRPLRDLHAPGDRADVRMPQRHRHLRRSRAPRRHRRLQRQDRAGVAARADQRRRRRFRRLRRQRALRGSPRPRMRSPSPPRSATPSTTSSRRRPARSRSTRWRSRPSPTPMGSGTFRRSRPGSTAVRGKRRYPLKLCTPKSRARTHSIHGNQPLLARVDRDDVWLHPEDAARARHHRRRARARVQRSRRDGAAGRA